MKQELLEVGSEIGNVGGKLIRKERQKQWERFQQDFQGVGKGDDGGAPELITDQSEACLFNLADS